MYYRGNKEVLLQLCGVWHTQFLFLTYEYLRAINYQFNSTSIRYETNYDDEFTQVRILKNNGDLLGVMNWFSVHATSMNMSNHLVSSDNLGYAALKLEATLNPGRPVGRVILFNILARNLAYAVSILFYPSYGTLIQFI